MPRKTFDVAAFRDWTNTALTMLPDEEVSQREALCSALEHVLHATGSYRGYQLHSSEYLPACEQTPDNVLREGADQTRRRYF